MERDRAEIDRIMKLRHEREREERVRRDEIKIKKDEIDREKDKKKKEEERAERDKKTLEDIQRKIREEEVKRAENRRKLSRGDEFQFQVQLKTQLEKSDEVGRSRGYSEDTTSERYSKTHETKTDPIKIEDRSFIGFDHPKMEKNSPPISSPFTSPPMSPESTFSDDFPNPFSPISLSGSSSHLRHRCKNYF